MTTTYDDVWVCLDCYLAHHGYNDHLNEDGTVTETGLEPFGLWVHDHHFADNTDSQTGEGIDTFSWRRCSGCGSNLGGARYRMAVFTS